MSKSKFELLIDNGNIDAINKYVRMRGIRGGLERDLEKMMMPFKSFEFQVGLMNFSGGMLAISILSFLGLALVGELTLCLISLGLAIIFGTLFYKL